MKNYKTIAELQEIKKLLLFCFDTYGARFYWLCNYRGLTGAEKGFILRGIK